MRRNLIYLIAIAFIITGCGKSSSKESNKESNKEPSAESTVIVSEETTIESEEETESKEEIKETAESEEVAESVIEEVSESEDNVDNPDKKEVTPSENGEPEDANANYQLMIGSWKLKDCYICSNRTCQYIKAGDGAEATVLLNEDWTAAISFATNDIIINENSLNAEYIDFGKYDEIANSEWTLQFKGGDSKKEYYGIYIHDDELLLLVYNNVDGQDEPDEWQIYLKKEH